MLIALRGNNFNVTKAKTVCLSNLTCHQRRTPLAIALVIPLALVYNPFVYNSYVYIYIYTFYIVPIHIVTIIHMFVDLVDNSQI